jgi:hypothetical protein
MAQVAAPSTTLTLNPIVLGAIKNGGYVVSYTGQVPAGATLLLGLPDTTRAVDVTGRPKTDLLDMARLRKLLDLFDQMNAWGTQVSCRLHVRQNGTTIAQSGTQTLRAPVRPYCGSLHPKLGKGDTGPRLCYTGIQTGRMLYQPDIDGRYYFAFGGKFETDNAKRGLNCITYVGGVCGVDPSSGAMSAYGTQLANHLLAQQVGMEGKSKQEVIQFFTTDGQHSQLRRGTFIVWNSGHTVLVVNGVVHEFALSKDGYNETPVAQWHFANGPFWVRQLRVDFELQMSV